MIRKIGLFLGSRPAQGGTFQYCQTMLEAVAALPVSMFQIVVAYSGDNWLEYLKDYRLSNLPVSLGCWRHFSGKLVSGCLPIKPWRTICPSFHPVARALIPAKCDLWIFPSQDTWSYLIPVPALGTIHDLMHRYERRFPEVSREYGRRERHYMKMCRWTKGVLVDSEVGKQQVIQSYGLAPQRIHVLPFIAPKYFYSEPQANEFENRYHLPSKFLFYPAQYWEHKNHKGLVMAAHRLRKQIPDLKFLFVGWRYNGYQSTYELVRRLDLKDHFLFFDYVPDQDIPHFYRKARALIMPTFFGPTNIPPLESMATGCPTAVSDIYGMKEQLRDAALYFNPSSIEDIAYVVKRLWEDDKLCQELSATGLVRARQWSQLHFNERFINIINLNFEQMIPNRF